MTNPNSFIELKENVQRHLEDVKNALDSPNCQIDILPTKKGQSETDPYSTAYTMLKLEYDSSDVKEVLKKLKVEDYIESIKDNRKIDSPPFWVFGTEISENQIYIKEKLRDHNNIFCVSFHFPKYPLKKGPY
ncbi:MAG: type II toxin-antitoxin system MqsR family toxin [Acetatifactor sp.]|nr:type II toxin-antitoxin system MqsR family toxin [Acetatifactor sp.]